VSVRPLAALAALALACTPRSAKPAPTPVAAPAPAPVVAEPVAPILAPALASAGFAAMPSLGPTSGQAPTSVVVMLHGYGANGADLRDVALTLAQSLPDTVFLLPDGLEALPGSPDGRQWFPLAGDDDARRLAGLRRAATQLSPWIDHELRSRSLTRARLGLVGFSQGAMLALDLGLHLDPAPAGVVSLSGRLVDGANPSPAPAPTLIVHGTADARIPVASASAALARLGQLHVRTESLIMPGVGHTITPAGMATAAAFLRRLWP
jgi:phospholipase/carboxylesterase